MSNCLLSPCRTPPRQQCRLSSGRQPPPLAQVSAGSHRDGRSNLLCDVRPPPSPSTAASWMPTSPSTTEALAAGLPTCTPLTLPASSTPLPPASRPPSDPPDSRPQSCYRVPRWTATEHRLHPATLYPLILYPSPQCNTHQSAEYETLLTK